jgi:hypothetical protein
MDEYMIDFPYFCSARPQHAICKNPTPFLSIRPPVSMFPIKDITKHDARLTS